MIDNNEKQSAEEIVLDVMRHFGLRRNYQVAKYFNVTPQTLSGWIKSGVIPPKHLIKYSNEVLNINNKKIHSLKDEGYVKKGSSIKVDQSFLGFRKLYLKTFFNNIFSNYLNFNHIYLCVFYC